MNKKTDNQTVRALFTLIPDPMDHFRKLLIQKDQKASEQAARDYCTANYQVTHGEEISRLKSETTEEDQRCKLYPVSTSWTE